MKPLSHVDDLLDGGHIERYHIKGQRMLTRQCVAEHSWRMAAILFNIWPEASCELVWATLFHDVSERVTGDMPANIKRHNPHVARALHDISASEEERLSIRFTLTDEEANLLGWLDRYEGALHCLDELEMGNRKVIATLNRYIMYAGDPKYTLRDFNREARRSQLLENLRVKTQALINHEEPQL